MVYIPTNLPAKIGYNTNLDTSFFIPLSNNLSIVNPTGQQTQVQSTSINDTLAGTGVQKVLITYFDTTWALKTEVVSTNGATPTLTVATDILRIEDFEAFQVGSMGSAIGTITLTNVSITPTNIFAQIDITFTKFLRAIHIVAPGHVSIMTDITANCPTTGGAFFSVCAVKDNTPNGGNQIEIPESAFILATNSIHIPVSIPILIPGNFPITCDARCSTVGIMMGMAVKGLAATQTAIASFHYLDIS